MESIFENETEGVGSDIEAYCPSPRCKADTNHTVISKYEDEIRRVQCVVCGDVHAYRKPRGDAYEEPSEPPLRRSKRKLSWEDCMARTTAREMESCRPYSIRDTYEEGDMVSHPTFHVGFVSELLPDNKVEVTFRDERRVLVHNRADLAPKMPAVAEMPVPRNDKKARRKKRSSDAPSDPLLNELVGPDAPESLEEKEAVAEQAARLKLASEREKIEKKLQVERKRAEEQRKRDAEQKRLDAEREKQRREEERERERLRKEKEKEQLRVRKDKEREKERQRKQREKELQQRERERLQRIKDRENLRKDQERDKLRRNKERDKLRKDKEKAKERQRAQNAKAAAAKASSAKAPARAAGSAKPSAQLRRTGGKKTVAASAAAAKKRVRR
jgi:hypothetical protein